MNELKETGCVEYVNALLRGQGDAFVATREKRILTIEVRHISFEGIL